MRDILAEKPQKQQSAADTLSAAFTTCHQLPLEEPTMAISPSGLSCQVSNAWKLKGGIPLTPQSESFQSRSFADAGTDRHARIQEFLSATEWWVDPEKYIQEQGLDLEVVERDGYEVLLWSPTYKVRFRCDGILLVDGVYYVLEIKTERQQANSYRTGPDAKHHEQGLCYCFLLKTPNILWVYEGRDFLQQRCFQEQYSQQDLEWMNKYLMDIQLNLDTPENLSRNTKNCGGCVFKNHCRKYFRDLELKRIKEGINAKLNG